MFDRKHQLDLKYVERLFHQTLGSTHSILQHTLIGHKTYLQIQKVGIIPYRLTAKKFSKYSNWWRLNNLFFCDEMDQRKNQHKQRFFLKLNENTIQQNHRNTLEAVLHKKPTTERGQVNDLMIRLKKFKKENNPNISSVYGKKE